MNKNLIEGLPASYDYNYVLKTDKKCNLCNKKINENEIKNNLILCSEEFNFFHKACIEESGHKIVFAKPNDVTSMIKVIAKGTCVI